MNVLEEGTSQFNVRWHSPINVLYHLSKLEERVGLKAIETKAEYKRAREARIGNIIALVLSNKRRTLTFLRLPRNDPPDLYIMQHSPNLKGTMDIITIEITKYIGNETLLDQLKRTKKIDPVKYSEKYILLVDARTNKGVELEKIKEYAQKQKIRYPIWIIREIQRSPDTIAEIVTIDTSIRSFKVNVGKEAFLLNKKYGNMVVFTKRTIRPEKVRTEKNPGECKTAPWEQLQD